LIAFTRGLRAIKHDNGCEDIWLDMYIDINKHEETLQNLGKFKTGVGCLYINKLTDIDQKQLEKLIKTALLNK